jgi:hypothetical protein
MNAGKWNNWYVGIEEPAAYGNTPSYEMGAAWLKNCKTVEDWGCGKGWFSTFVKPDRYRGIDGSKTPFANEVVDLTQYHSQVEGIFMRHVLEHDFRWAEILDNALESFTKRMFLVLFTPLADTTGDIEFEDPPGVPNIAFRLSDLTDRMDGLEVEHETFASETKYDTETVFRISR